jgi:hypothetical protein
MKVDGGLGIGIKTTGGAVGLDAAGSRAAAHFGPGGTPPPAGGPSVAGDLIVADGQWVACVADGDLPNAPLPTGHPGAFRVLASPMSAGSLHLLVPFRAYDSRVEGGTLANGTMRSVAFPASGLSKSIDTGATALCLNVTITETVGSGFLAVFAGGTSWPGTSNLNWFGDGQIVSNSALVALPASRTIEVLAGGPAVGSTQVVIDVFGFYR